MATESYSIAYFAPDDTMGDTSPQDCNAFRKWAEVQLRARYPQHAVEVLNRPAAEQVFTDDNERRDEIAFFVSCLWDRCPWDRVEAEAVVDMGACIASCGYALEGPLREGVDYEVVANRYAVMVRTAVDTWTTHSTWATRSEAQDQADYVGGRVVEVDANEEDTTP